jgi:hypothetical protein
VLIAKINAIRRENGAAVEEDRMHSEQAQKEGKEYARVYSAIKNGTGSLEVI